tara:strand:+ start:416 stop:3370 length:2955 start_codon:yes stop_codon:yes gene_type:complete
MAKRRRSVRTVNQRIPIYTLSGGVGRQAPSKRLPSEAQEIENCFVTLEKSVAKRNGFEIFRSTDTTEFQYSLPIEDLEDKDLWFHWFDVAGNARYLIVIDFNATTPSKQFIWIFRLKVNGWIDISPANETISLETRRYLTHRNEEYSTAKEALRAVSIGQELLILNRTVKAGFTSQEDGPAWPFGIGTAPVAGLADASFKSFQITGGGYGNSRAAVNVSGKGVGLVATTSSDGKSIVSVEDPGSGYKLNDIVNFPGNGGNATFILTNVANFMFDYDGELLDDVDLKGRGITYFTSATQDPKSEATEWAINTAYLLGDKVVYGATYDTRKVYENKVALPEGQTTFEAAKWTDTGVFAKLIEVADFVYPDGDFPYRGQAVKNFGDLKFPPPAEDISANNGSITTQFSDGKPINRTSETLRALYTDIGHINAEGEVTGLGKVYFTAASYLSASPGYYRIISKNIEEGGLGRPFTQKIRTPDAHGVLDSRRMPVRLSLKSSNAFAFEEINWDERTAGDKKTNPGPTIFTKDDGTLRQIEINSMAFYRGRLFFSAADTLFASRIADIDNFWLNDPSTIVASDPIDLQASSNKYSRINAMVPFADYLFINTDSDTQFELMGSENTITPFTAELAPTAFYSTAPLIDPILMGSQIFFFSPQRMYIYFSTATASLSTATEVSAHCPDYLPENFGSVTVAGSRDTVLFVDEDSKNKIFVYTNRYAAERVVQNAFHKWILNADDSVEALTFFDDRVYAVVKKPRGDGTDILYIERIAMAEEEYNRPRIDHRYLHIINETNSIYNTSDDTTTFYLPYLAPNTNQVILWDGWGEEKYVQLPTTSVTTNAETKQTEVKVQGNYATVDNRVYFGESFLMNVELSPLFYRDQNNNIINGVLNLKSMSVRHSNTGNYRIEVKRRGRSEVTTTFNINQVDKFNQTLGSLLTHEVEGELTTKILGFADETQIFIKSDYPTPVNISNMEIKAMFRPTHSSVLD